MDEIKQQALEKISAFVDGELADDEIADVVDALASEPELQSAWSEFQLIGDILRATPAPAVDVTAQVMAALAATPEEAVESGFSSQKPKRSVSL
ncbi:MAG: Anti sigma-E protein RseA, N-terminal domain [Pseudomonadota bacterium]|jgi:negative regulator of sigma E activity